ncbi:MAG: hypothetical protein A2479_02190 [Candidatus Magasanikbacteria bacterium RIFOXYC2_FULL_39_8]|nr:MAG: hypothetical protein A2479_02190 [Candidatus Magasanikbacteria bacterium RIFOXYC2_FULL_39_8]
MYTSHVISKKYIAQDTLEIHLARPSDFVFQAGQFVQVIIEQDDRQFVRSYSLSSTPTDSDIELCIKLMPEGIGSNFFRSIEVENTIQIRGPYGRFIYPSSDGSCIFVATGAGLAPIMSILRDILEHDKTIQSLYLLFGVRHMSDIFWHDRLEELHTKFPQFSYDITLSRPESDTWNGFTGRVVDHLYKTPREAKNFFLCGNPSMVQDVRKLIIDRGTPQNQIYLEVF